MACLHGERRLGHVQRNATPTWSTAVAYGSAPLPRQEPHTARSSHAVVCHRAWLASGRADDITPGVGAAASTCSTDQRPVHGASTSSSGGGTGGEAIGQERTDGVRHDSGVTMRVMTWNLWWRFGPWEDRQPAIRAVLADQDPDVVFLQEAWATDTADQVDELAGALGLHAVRGEPVFHDGVAFGNAVLSRWPVTPLADVTLPGHDGTPGHRRLVAGVIGSPWGRWPVASTHLDHRFDAGATRQMQVRRLLELAVEMRGDPRRDLPLVLGADLNAVPDSDEVRMITGRRPGVAGIVMSDVWEQVGDGPGQTWRRDNPYTATSAWPGRRLDYLLVSWPRPKPVGNPVRAWLAGTEPVSTAGPAETSGGRTPVVPSDHAAVVADLITPADQIGRV